MAIVKVVKKSGKTYKSLKKVLSYVGEKACETYGINCNDSYKKVAYKFLETKDYFQKTNGRQYRHYIQSFSPNEVSKEKILEIAIKWAEKSFLGHEIFIAVHDDKEHLHSHFIVNTVNFETGEKLHETACNLAFKKSLNDEICLSYGIDNNKNIRNKGDIVAYDKSKYQIIKKGADITRLAEKIIKNMQVSISKDDFILKMKNDGYTTEWAENKKNVVFTVDPEILQGKKDKFRLLNLEKIFNISDFDKDKLLDIFKANQKAKENHDLKEIITHMEISKISKEEKDTKISNFEKINQKKDFELEL